VVLPAVWWGHQIQVAKSGHPIPVVWSALPIPAARMSTNLPSSFANRRRLTLAAGVWDAATEITAEKLTQVTG
jgi:hypothetical protein